MIQGLAVSYELWQLISWRRALNSISTFLNINNKEIEKWLDISGWSHSNTVCTVSYGNPQHMLIIWWCTEGKICNMLVIIVLFDMSLTRV